MAPPELFARILVGVDSGGLAVHAVQRGLALARELGSEVELVHAVEVPPALWPGIDRKKLAAIHSRSLVQARVAALHALRDAADQADEADTPLDSLLTVLPGHPAVVLLEHIAEIGAELVVLGPHARRSLFDFGGTTRAVLSRATVPLWFQTEPPSPVRSILVPVDFSEHSRRALDCARALATRLEASVRVCHCYEPPAFAYAPDEGPTFVVDQDRAAAREELDRWTAASQWAPVRVESRFAEGDAIATLVEQAASADLIVMGTHGRTGLSRFLIGGVTYGVLKSAPRPVLVVPGAGTSFVLEDDVPLDARAPGASEE